MRAVRVIEPGRSPVVGEIDAPEPGPGEVLIEVEACGVCRTDLHIVDGEIPTPKLPIVPGHEIVGRIAGLGDGASRFALGDRVGVPWLGWACGECDQCRRRAGEPLPECRVHRLATGTAATPSRRSPTSATAWRCRKATRCRRGRAAALRRADRLPLAAAGRRRRPRLGLYGFGAAAHIVAQVAVHQGRRVFAFTRAGDAEAQDFARSTRRRVGGASDDAPPEPLDAAIIFAPVGAAGAGGAPRRSARRVRRLRRHPHVGHPGHALRAPLG